MASRIIEAPVEATRIAAHKITKGSQAIFETGSSLAGHLRSDHDEEVVEELAKDLDISQRILGEHLGKVGLLGYNEDEENREDKAIAALQLAAYERVVDDDMIVEVRPFLRDEDLKDKKLVSGIDASTILLSKTLKKKFGISSVFSTRPIFVPDHDKETVVTTGSWMNFAFELDGFQRQIKHEDKDVAMLAIAPPELILNAFRGRTFDADHLNDGLLIMRHVDDDPLDNVLIPSFKPLDTQDERPA